MSLQLSHLMRVWLGSSAAAHVILLLACLSPVRKVYGCTIRHSVSETDVLSDNIIIAFCLWLSSIVGRPVFKREGRQSMEAQHLIKLCVVMLQGACPSGAEAERQRDQRAAGGLCGRQAGQHQQLRSSHQPRQGAPSAQQQLELHLPAHTADSEGAQPGHDGVPFSLQE